MVDITARFGVTFPARVVAGTGMSVSVSNGIFTFAQDYTGLTTAASIDAPTTTGVLTYDSASGLYRLVTIEDIIASVAQTGSGYAIAYTIDTGSTADEDPGAGILRFDNATQSSATTLYADLADSNGMDWTTILDSLDDSTSTVKGFWSLTKIGDASKRLVGTLSLVTSATGYRKITVAVTGSSASNPFADGDGALFSFVRGGDGMPSTLTLNGVLIGQGSGQITATAAGTTGTVLSGTTDAAPSFKTQSALLDSIGSTRGQILYRGASAWAALSPGTAGQVLTSNGAGADPSYQTGELGSDYPTRAALAAASVASDQLYARTAGYTTVGDGGGALYKRVGAEPAHDGKVQSADGAWWELSDTGRVNARSLGATGDGVTDDAAAVQAAIDVVEAAGTSGGVIYFPNGTYLLGSTITLSEFGVVLLGESPTAATLKASHSDGPVVRIKRSHSGIENMIIDATAARTAGAAGSNYGIHLEPDDDPSLFAAFCQFSSVIIRNQPNHGFVAIAGFESLLLQQVICDDNSGHGFVFDRGNVTSRTNKRTCGLASLFLCRAVGNTGHGLVAGALADAASFVYRIILDNFETYDNALAAGVRNSAHQIWMRGENFEIRNSAFGGDSGTTGGIWISGRIHRIKNNRFIECSSSVQVGHDTDLTTRDIEVAGLRVVTTAQNPAVIVDSGAENVRAYNGVNANITSLMTSGVPGGESHQLTDRVWDGTLQLPNDGLRLLDSDESHYIAIKPGSNVTANRNLTLTTGDADRTLDISADDVTVSSFGAGLVAAATARAAANTIKAPYVIDAWAGTSAHTGDTNETTLRTITIPGGALGTFGQVEIDISGEHTNSGNAKTYRVRIGGTSGTVISAPGMTTSASVRFVSTFANANSASAQVGGSGTGVSNGLGISTTALPTATVNTASDFDIVISGQLADAGESIALRRVSVKVLTP